MVLPLRAAVPSARVELAVFALSERCPYRAGHDGALSGEEGTRTPCLLCARQVLYQMSYNPKDESGRRDSNPRLRRGGAVRYQLRHDHMSGSGDSNPVYAWLEARCPTSWATTAWN